MANAAKRTFTGLPVCEVIEKVAGVNNAVTVIRSTEWQQYQHYPLKAVWPILDRAALSLCYQRYEAYEKAYNERVERTNTFVERYNGLVHSAIEASESPEAYRHASRNFRASMSAMDVWAYNKLVSERNEAMGNMVYPMRKAQRLKNEHRLCFRMILRKYELDLLKMLRAFKKNQKQDFVTIPKVDINSSHLQNLTNLGGARMTNQSRATIRRQKKRLEEAGILQDRASRGHKRGVNYFINPEIMAISDDFSGKTMVSDNQLLKMLNSTKCTDIYTLTCTIKQDNLNDVDKPTSDIRKKSDKESDNTETKALGFLTGSPPAVVSTCTPSGMDPKKSSGAEFSAAGNENGTASPDQSVDQPPKNLGMSAATTKNEVSGSEKTTVGTPISKDFAGDTPQNGEGTRSISSKNSDDLRKKLLPAWDFSVKVTDGECSDDDITPLNKLVLESSYGTLDHNEYTDLILQNLFILFARMYRFKKGYRLYHKLVFQLYQEWSKSYFFHNRNGHVLDKNTILERYRKMVFAITSKRHGAMQRINRGKFDPPCIEVYLNPHSATPGTLLHHYKRLEKKAPGIDRDIETFGENMKRLANESKVYSLYKHRLFRKFSEHARGRIDDNQLFRYASDNLPLDLQRDFDRHWTVFINNKKTD